MNEIIVFVSRGVFDATLCDKACQRLATDRWFSPCIPISSTNKLTVKMWLNIDESGVKHYNSPSAHLYRDYQWSVMFKMCHYVHLNVTFSKNVMLSKSIRFHYSILSYILFCKRQQNEFRYKNTKWNRTHFRLPWIVFLYNML